MIKFIVFYGVFSDNKIYFGNILVKSYNVKDTYVFIKKI